MGGNSNIVLYKNSGLGDFEYYNILKTRLGDPSALGFGDFNADNKIDIAVVSPGSAEQGKGYLSIFYGKGEGVFKKRPKNFRTGLDPNSMAIGDLDRDGISDLVIANSGLTEVGHNTGKIQIFFGRKNRRLFTIKNRKAGKYPESVVIDDFNNDKNLDIVYSANKQDSIFALLGNGKRKFREKESSGFKTKGIGNSFLAQGFFDSNKKLDIAVTIFKYGPCDILTFLYGNGKGKFMSSSVKIEGSELVLFEDLDNDEIDDLVTIDSAGLILKGKGEGTFSDPISFFSAISMRAVVGDLNGDGFLDFITAGHGAGYITILLNTTNN